MFNAGLRDRRRIATRILLLSEAWIGRQLKSARQAGTPADGWGPGYERGKLYLGLWDD